MNQSNAGSLNLHPNFKWVLCANHTEPVKNYLNRYLERRLVDYETRYQIKSNDLEQIINWIPKLWQHINKHVELYNSIDCTLGPKIFSTFPMDIKQAQSWFIELWNNLLVPFMIDTIKEGVQVYGMKITTWEDPKLWLTQTLPWMLYDSCTINNLFSIEGHHVGYEGDSNEFADNQDDKRSISVMSHEQMGNNRGSSTDESECFTQLGDNDSNPADSDDSLMQNNKIVMSQRVMNMQTDVLNNTNENDKLLSMLMRLQEVTLNQKRTQNNTDLIKNINDMKTINLLANTAVESTL